MVDLAKAGVKRSDADLIAEETKGIFMIQNNPRVPSIPDLKQVILNVMDDYGIE